MSYSQESAQQFIEKWYHESVIPSLSDFIRIPNLSRSFDKDYQTNGLLQKAANHIKSWVESIGLKGLKTELLQPEDLTPLLLAEIQGEIKDKAVLFYGHFDKQPHGSGWDENKGPTTPIIQNDRLYGRGSSDDGYSAYNYMLAIRALQQQGIPLPKIILLLEGDEQSGGHIDIYLQRLKERLGNIDNVFVLDSNVGDFDNFWNTKSIRGALGFVVKIQILRDGVHSGDSSGIVPSTFKIANQLISRLENLQNGEVHEYFQRDITVERYQEFYQNARDIGMKQFSYIKTVPGLQTASSNPLYVLLNKGWKPTLTVTGLTGFPPTQVAGNVMLPEISFRVSIRLPPTFQKGDTEAFLNQLLTKNTPFGATVKIEDFDIGEGWNAKSYEPWFQEVIEQSSKEVFGTRPYAMAQGGTIPLIGTIAKTWPKASIIVSGALGPNSNAHGPNEFLHIPYAIKMTRMIASIVAKGSLQYAKQ